MNSLYRYGWEKLHLAVLHLASAQTPLRQRLHDAYIHNIQLIGDEDLPTEQLRERLGLLRSDLFEPNLKKNLELMSDDMAVGFAREIVSMYYEVARYDAF